MSLERNLSGISHEQAPSGNDVSVDIPENGSGKFILCEVTVADGGKKFVLRANETDTRHRQILDKVRLEFPDAEVKILGGGRIAYYGPAIGNEMALSEKSDEFGKEDRELTKKLLKEAYPDRDIVEE